MGAHIEFLVGVCWRWDVVECWHSKEKAFRLVSLEGDITIFLTFPSDIRAGCSLGVVVESSSGVVVWCYFFLTCCWAWEVLGAGHDQLHIDVVW